MPVSLMHWLAPSEKDTDNAALEKRLWDAAEQATPVPVSGRKSPEYSRGRPQGSVLGLIFLRFAEVSIHGVQKAQETVCLCLMNQAA